MKKLTAILAAVMISTSMASCSDIGSGMPAGGAVLVQNTEQTTQAAVTTTAETTNFVLLPGATTAKTTTAKAAAALTPASTKGDKLEYHSHVNTTNFTDKNKCLYLAKKRGSTFYVSDHATTCFYGFGDRAASGYGMDGQKINYKANVLKHQRYTDGYYVSDTSQYVSQNYTGVCLDFSQIYAIMCRETGIPCVVLTNSHHARNAVYLAETGDWHEVDLTLDVHRHVYGEDLNDVTGDTLYSYRGFLDPTGNGDKAETAVGYSW